MPGTFKEIIQSRDRKQKTKEELEYEKNERQVGIKHQIKLTNKILKNIKNIDHKITIKKRKRAHRAEKTGLEEICLFSKLTISQMYLHSLTKPHNEAMKRQKELRMNIYKLILNTPIS